MSYTPGGVDPVSRIRDMVGDTDTSNELFVDAVYTSWLARHTSGEQLLVYLPSGTDGFTSATAEVRVSSNTLLLDLKRGSEATQTITLAPSYALGRVEGLVDAIRALNKGWVVGFAFDALEYFVEAAVDPRWKRSIPSATLRAIPSLAKSADLVVTGGTVSAYGDEDTPARLRFYYYAAVALEAWHRIQGLPDEDWTERRDGNMSWARDPKETEARRVQFAAAAAWGLYA